MVYAMVFCRGETRPPTSDEYRTVRVHGGSTQSSGTEASSASPRCHAFSAGIWLYRPTRNVHNCRSKRLESKFHLGLPLMVATDP